MPRRDDELDDDDRPRRRPRDEDDEDRPRRSRRLPDDEDDRPPRKKSNTGLVVGILVGVFVLCCGGGGFVAYRAYVGAKKGLEQVGNVLQEAGETAQSQQNLTQIGAAAHAHANAMGFLPNNSYDVQNGRPRGLLSWRVHLLPYLGEQALYNQFKFDEPWDGPNNIRLIPQMPMVYGGPATQKKSGPGKTFYRGFSAPGGLFEKPAAGNVAPKISLAASIPDGLSNTILVVDAGEAVEWTKLDDLDFSPGRPRPTFGGAYPTLPFALVLMADGTVHQMRKDVPDETLRKLIDRKDGMVIPPGWEANR